MKTRTCPFCGGSGKADEETGCVCEGTGNLVDVGELIAELVTCGTEKESKNDRESEDHT